MGLLKHLFSEKEEYSAIPDEHGLTYSNTPSGTIYVAETSRHQNKIAALKENKKVKLVLSKDAKLPNKNWHVPNNPYALVNSRNELLGTLSEHSFKNAGYLVGDYVDVVISNPLSEHEEYTIGVVPKGML